MPAMRTASPSKTLSLAFIYLFCLSCLSLKSMSLWITSFQERLSVGTGIGLKLATSWNMKRNKNPAKPRGSVV